MTVKRSTQPLLVEVVSDETNATAKDEQTIQTPYLDALIRLFTAKSTAIAKQINEADGNTTVNVEDEGILLGSGDLLHSEGIIEKSMAREVLQDVLLNELDTKIRVVN